MSKLSWTPISLLIRDKSQIQMKEGEDENPIIEDSKGIDSREEFIKEKLKEKKNPKSNKKTCFKFKLNKDSKDMVLFVIFSIAFIFLIDKIYNLGIKKAIPIQY